MFTGIIEDIGTISALTPSTLSVKTRLSEINLGDSISVNGICLTVTGVEQTTGTAALRFDYSPETKSRTTIGSLNEGSPVNLERALPIGGRLGGHFVTGHVEDTGTLVGREPEGDSWTLRFSFDEHLRKFIVPKGSITVNGISLTVAECRHGQFTVAIIPHTMHHTNLGGMRIGDRVNLEPDILAMYVENILQHTHHHSRITLDLLKEHGFIHD